MAESKVTKHSLTEFVQQIAPILEEFPATEDFVFSIENLEANLQALELRIQHIQEEIDILIEQ